MLRTLVIVSLSLGACAPTTHNTPVYVAGGGPAGHARPRAIAVRGRIPRGKAVDRVVAVEVDARGRRRRIHVRPAADGSYQLQLPAGHRYAMAYEDQGRVVGDVDFPAAGGKRTQVINVSQNVVVQQNNYVDLGVTTYVDGAYVAANDPGAYLDSDGDGIVDDQDSDAVAVDEEAIDEGAFEGGDAQDVDEGDGATWNGDPGDDGGDAAAGETPAGDEPAPTGDDGAE
jgi:hypothetical protein